MSKTSSKNTATATNLYKRDKRRKYDGTVIINMTTNELIHADDAFIASIFKAYEGENTPTRFICTDGRFYVFESCALFPNAHERILTSVSSNLRYHFDVDAVRAISEEGGCPDAVNKILRMTDEEIEIVRRSHYDCMKMFNTVVKITDTILNGGNIVPSTRIVTEFLPIGDDLLTKYATDGKYVKLSDYMRDLSPEITGGKEITMVVVLN